MFISYKINNEKHFIEFCPDGEGVEIKKKNKPYTNIANDLLKSHHSQKVLLVIDTKIEKKIIKYLIHDLKLLKNKIYILYFDGEKKNKNIKNLLKLINYFFSKKFIKKSVLISFGGGVIGDLCGLASSLYLRGLIHMNIPTTMTAIVDSCVGGKTGINYKGAINSLGNYYHPKKIFISKNVINFIPYREYISGLPEILKCGLIDNNHSLKLLKNSKAFLNRDFELLTKIIKITLKTKIKFFKDDIYEQNNRLKLNFGHTFAHAIEMALAKFYKKKEIIRHGEAVGIGMLCEVYYAYGKNKEFELIKKILTLYNLPINLISLTNKTLLKKEIFKNVFLDKKRISSYPRYIKLQKIGHTIISEMKNYNRIKKTINEVLF